MHSKYTDSIRIVCVNDMCIDHAGRDEYVGKRTDTDRLNECEFNARSLRGLIEDEENIGRRGERGLVMRDTVMTRRTRTYVYSVGVCL